MIKSGHECSSSDVELPKAHSAGECANAVREAGGQFFIFFQVLENGVGNCHWEKTKSADCADGTWEVDDKFDFYALTGKCLYIIFYYKFNSISWACTLKVYFSSSNPCH